MIRVIVFICVGVCSVIEGFSQHGGGSRQAQFDRIESQKIAYITKELTLTPKESEAFFPLYNEYRKALHTLLREKNDQARRPDNQNTRVDVLSFDSKILDLRKHYRLKFAPVIGHARASRFFEVEQEFRENLIKQLNHRREDGGRHH